MSAESLQITELGRRLGLPLGWDTGDRDPWGTPQLFHNWLVAWWKPELDSLMFTITALSRGSTHVADLCYRSVGPVDWPEVTPGELLRMVELGGWVEDRIRRLGVPPGGNDGAVSATSTNGTVLDPRDQGCGRAWVNSLRVRL